MALTNEEIVEMVQIKLRGKNDRIKELEKQVAALESDLKETRQQLESREGLVNNLATILNQD